MTGAEQTANITAGFRVAADEGVAGEGTGVSPPCSARSEARALPARHCRGGKSKGASHRGPGQGLASVRGALPPQHGFTEVAVGKCKAGSRVLIALQLCM